MLHSTTFNPEGEISFFKLNQNLNEGTYPTYIRAINKNYKQQIKRKSEVKAKLVKITFRSISKNILIRMESKKNLFLKLFHFKPIFHNSFHFFIHFIIFSSLFTKKNLSSTHTYTVHKVFATKAGGICHFTTPFCVFIIYSIYFLLSLSFCFLF